LRYNFLSIGFIAIGDYEAVLAYLNID